MKTVVHPPPTPMPVFTEFCLVYSSEVNMILLKEYEGITSDITGILKQYIDQYCCATINQPHDVVGLDVLTTRLFQAVSHFFEFVMREAKLDLREDDALRDFLGRLTIQAYQKGKDTPLVILMDLSPEVFEVPVYVEDLYIHILSTYLHTVH